MTDLPDVKFKALVSFPAQVVGGTGLAVVKANSTYTFNLAFSELAQITSIPTSALPTTFLALWESTQDTYRRMSVPDLQTQVGGGGGSGGIPAVQGRLTLTSGIPVTETDVAGATTIYFTPSGGNGVSIYDGAQWQLKTIAELILPLDSNAAHTGYHQLDGIFDLFAINDTGTVRLVTGPSWVTGGGSDIARGTGTEIETFAGVPVNKNTITGRFGANSGDTISVPARRATYVGSFRATANGQATDSRAKRLLFNAYNAIERLLFIPAPATHDYSLTSPRVINNDLSNRVDILLGLTGTMVHLEATNTIGNSTATYRVPANAINLDLSTVSFGKWVGVSSVSFACLDCFYDGYPGLGYHALYWIEVGAGTDVQTWYQTGSVMAGSIAL